MSIIKQGLGGSLGWYSFNGYGEAKFWGIFLLKSGFRFLSQLCTETWFSVYPKLPKCVYFSKVQNYAKFKIRQCANFRKLKTYVLRLNISLFFTLQSFVPCIVLHLALFGRIFSLVEHGGGGGGGGLRVSQRKAK